MKISVVTISFNQAKYLRQCMNSVLEQDYENIEYIVVDPGSTDGSREVIESYGNRVVKIFEKDSGPADGLNKGFDRATGDILFFINSDDLIFPGAFKRVSELFLSNPDVDVLLAGGNEIDADGVVIRSFYPSSVSAKAYVNGAVTLFQQGMFFRADVFRSVGGFNKNNKTSWDGELLLQFLLANARILRIMEKIAAFRIYPESITGSQRFAKQFENDRIRMYKQVYGQRASPSSSVGFFYRFLKLLRDPFYIYKRICG